MSPVSAFSQLLGLNNKAGGLLLTGLAVIAVAAIAASWNVDIHSAGLSGLYIALLGTILYVAVTITESDKLKAVVSWFVVGLFIAGATTVFLSVVLQSTHWFPPTRCLVRFWDDCQANVEKNPLSEGPDTKFNANKVTSANADRRSPPPATFPLSELVPLPKRFDKPGGGYFTKRGNLWFEFPEYAPNQNFTFEQFSEDDGYVYLLDRSRPKAGEPANFLLVRLPLRGGAAQWSYQNPISWTNLTVVSPEPSQKAGLARSQPSETTTTPSSADHHRRAKHPSSQPSVHIGSVSSSNQAGGITAGQIGTVNGSDSPEN